MQTFRMRLAPADPWIGLGGGGMGGGGGGGAQTVAKAAAATQLRFKLVLRRPGRVIPRLRF